MILRMTVGNWVNVALNLILTVCLVMILRYKHKLIESQHKLINELELLTIRKYLPGATTHLQTGHATHNSCPYCAVLN